MKRMTTMIFILMSIELLAPESKTAVIIEGEAITVYDPMLNAFQFVESSFDTDTINRLGYGGILQIGQEMTDEANRICKLTGNPARFMLSDRLDSTKSVQMWYIVQRYWNPKYSVKTACKIWNPLASNRYFLKVQKAML